VQIASECFGYEIYIQGHTDSTSSEKYNLYLSKRRAQRVSTILKSFNIDPKRVHIQWFGETKPVATNITQEGRYQNRRVEVYFK
jgi:outer membrane protein OmpA-like peptidoglycan-associated protein